MPIDNAGQIYLHSHNHRDDGDINLLLMNRANPHIKDADGVTPLKLAQKVVANAKVIFLLVMKERLLSGCCHHIVYDIYAL